MRGVTNAAQYQSSYEAVRTSASLTTDLCNHGVMQYLNVGVQVWAHGDHERLNRPTCSRKPLFIPGVRESIVNFKASSSEIMPSSQKGDKLHYSPRTGSSFRFGSSISLFLILLWSTLMVPTEQSANPIGSRLSRIIGLQRRNPTKEKDGDGDTPDFWDSLEQTNNIDNLSTDEPTLLQSLRKLLDDPSDFLRSVGNGMKLGLAAYSVVLVWKLYTELSKVLLADSEDSIDNQSLIESFVKRIEEREQVPDREKPSKLWEDGRSQHWITLIQKLQASGMPLRSEEPDKPSVVKVLPSLTKAEISILQQCLVDPRSVDDSERIFGLQGELNTLEILIRQLKTQQSSVFGVLFGSGNKFSCPGVLLYGPPGCGKSMLIRHAAADARVPCLTLTPSLLLRKFVGESNLQVRTLFTLIAKLSPCVLFIDEIDGLFRERSSDEHHVLREIKTEFLQYWDGLLSDKSVLVIGASNRPFDVDAAVLRRLPQCWYVDPPNAAVRKQLWIHWLSQVPVEANIDVDKLVELTDRYTHSDIRHVLQVAALEGPMTRQESNKISFEDIVEAMSSVSGSRSSDLYMRQLWSFIHKHDEGVLKHAITCWETADGRFYSLGTLNIDADAIHIIMDIVKELQDENGADDDLNEDDDDL